MRVLHIVSNPFLLDRGGLTRTLGQVRGTISRGHDVLVCSYSGGKDVEGVKVVRIPWVWWYKNTAGGTHDLHRLYLDFSLLLYSIYIAFRYRPDVVHSHGLTGILAGSVYRLFFSRTIVVQDSEGTYADEMFPGSRLVVLKFIVYTIEKILYNLTDGIVTCSNLLPEFLKSKYGIRKPMQFVPEGIIEEKDGMPIDRASLGIRDDHTVVGFAGQFHVHQGMGAMIEAFRRVARDNARARFLLVGYPVEELLRKHPIESDIRHRFIFTGAVPYSRVRNYLALMDIAVTAKQFESFPGNGKLVEYIEARLPVVAFDHPVNRFYLGDDAAYAEMGNVLDFGQKIMQLLDSVEERQRLREKMALRRRDLLWGNVVVGLISFYQYLLEERNGQTK